MLLRLTSLSKILLAFNNYVLNFFAKIKVSWWWSLISTPFKETLPKKDKSTFSTEILVLKSSFTELVK